MGKDALGSVRSATNGNGALEERYEYDAFGKPYTGDLGSGMMGYTGKPYDALTGLYDYGYRDYQPQVARFTTVAPVRDGSNWFAYVNNDPVNYIDLWGLSANDRSTVTSLLSNNNFFQLGQDLSGKEFVDSMTQKVKMTEYKVVIMDVNQDKQFDVKNDKVDFAIAEKVALENPYIFNGTTIEQTVKYYLNYGYEVISNPPDASPGSITVINSKTINDTNRLYRIAPTLYRETIRTTALNFIAIEDDGE